MPEATAGLSSGSWGASAGLPGRFSDNDSYKGAMSVTGPANRRFMREARLSDKSREISVITHSEAGIPWVLIDTVEMKFSCQKQKYSKVRIWQRNLSQSNFRQDS